MAEINRKRKRLPQRIDLEKLIYPVFVVSGKGQKQRAPLMPGVFRFSVDSLIKEVGRLNSAGINKFLLFGVPERKTWNGADAYKENSIVAIALRALRQKFPDAIFITDICLCAYTAHGHCGIIPAGTKHIKRNETLSALLAMAAVHAAAGADYVAPSAMAAGQVKAIRRTLDRAGFPDVGIMGYSAKFASNFYGPFRAIAGSAPAFGDRSGYQLDYRSSQAAWKKIKEDILGGADIVMVKPAVGYLDVVRMAKESFDKPLAVYNVSGEFAFVKKGARAGMWDEKEMVREIFEGFQRAGADYIITYHAKDIARWQAQL